MLFKILLGVVALLAILAIFIATRPTGFRVTRSAAIAAPAAVVFAQVNDFRKWSAWNPWAKLDPAMQEAYDGAAAGVGASYAWEGNGNVGAGRLTITESRPHALIRIRQDFRKPMAAVNTAEFTFKEEGGQTAITWTMSGKHNFIAKAVHLVVDVDKMIGGRFEQGLAGIKAVSEAAAKR